MWQGHAIKTSRPDAALGSVDEYVSLKLGGTTLWAPTPQILNSGVSDLLHLLKQATSSFLTATRPVLKKSIEDLLDTEKIDEKVFGACLGASMRLGELDELIVFSENDRPYRVSVHSSQKVRLLNSIYLAKNLLQAQEKVTIKELEAKVFGRRAYNTWSSCAHIFGHLSFIGFAASIDRMTYEIVKFK
jgi:hypothetical protein